MSGAALSAFCPDNCAAEVVFMTVRRGRRHRYFPEPICRRACRAAFGENLTGGWSRRRRARAGHCDRKPAHGRRFGIAQTVAPRAAAPAVEVVGRFTGRWDRVAHSRVHFIRPGWRMVSLDYWLIRRTELMLRSPFRSPSGAYCVGICDRRKECASMRIIARRVVLP